MPPEPIWGKRAAKLGKYVILADLHLGLELELGIDATILSKRILEEVLFLSCYGDRLIILGDLKHQIISFEKEEIKLVDLAIKELSERFSEIILIKGNHDGGIENRRVPENFVIIGSSGMLIQDTYLLHGHAWPEEDVFRAKYLLMGHTHPVLSRGAEFSLGRIPVWVIGATNAVGEKKIGKKKVAVIPAFNSVLLGTNVKVEGLLDVIYRSGMLSDKLKFYTIEGIRLFEHLL